jgi:hypothetical protein
MGFTVAGRRGAGLGSGTPLIILSRNKNIGGR